MSTAIRHSLLSVFTIGVVSFSTNTGSQTATTPEPDWSLPSKAVIHQLLAERMEHNGVGIVVGVIDENGPRVIAYGSSGADDNRPLDGDTIFQIGSITKVFTTLLLIDMVERGEVGLDDPAQNYLPESVKLPQKGHAITLHDLATHTSGLPSMPSNFDIHGKPDPFAAYTGGQLYQFLSGYTLTREPGTQNSYSNLGVALLGRLLASRENRDYETLLTERILSPLDMHDTAIHLNEDQQRRLAPGHDTYLQPVNTWEMVAMPASGSLRSSAHDMLKLIAPYIGLVDTPLSSAMTRQLRDGVVLEGRKHPLGWHSAGDNLFRHSGGKEGYRSGIVIDVDRQIGAIVLANARTADLPINIASHLVTGAALEPAPRAPPNKPRIEVAPETLSSYEGHYQLPNGDMLQVVRLKNGLVVRYPGSALLQFAATAPHAFFYVSGNDDIVFKVDGNGRVVGLTLYGDGKTAGRSAFAERVSP